MDIPTHDHTMADSNNFLANPSDDDDSRGGKAVRLSYDHKGSDAQEAKRITNAGGFVMNSRVNGVLAVTRSLGDSAMKEFVVGSPYTTETVLGSEDSFLIIACDGVSLSQSRSSCSRFHARLTIHCLHSFGMLLRIKKRWISSRTFRILKRPRNDCSSMPCQNSVRITPRSWSFALYMRLDTVAACNQLHPSSLMSSLASIMQT